MGPRAFLEGCEKSRPQRDLIPDCPARSESLYRLSYPGPLSIGLVAVKHNTLETGDIVIFFLFLVYVSKCSVV